MSIAGVLTRFSILYLVLIFAGGLVLRMLGVDSRSGLNVAILVVAVMWPCTAFAKNHGRYFTPAEKVRVVWGMIGINLAIQLLFGAMAVEGELPAWILLFVVGFVGVVHSIAIYFFVGLGGRTFENAQAKKVGVDG